MFSCTNHWTEERAGSGDQPHRPQPITASCVVWVNSLTPLSPSLWAKIKIKILTSQVWCEDQKWGLWGHRHATQAGWAVSFSSSFSSHTHKPSTSSVKEMSKILTLKKSTAWASMADRAESNYNQKRHKEMWNVNGGLQKGVCPKWPKAGC